MRTAGRFAPSGFSAYWDGRAIKGAVHIIPDPDAPPPAIGHFGHGVLTFHVPCLFRTEPGVDLLVTGPLNRPKDGLAPLTGIIEADCAPYTFTMNWLFTRAQLIVRFERGEPFCHIFPVGRGSLEQIEPEMRRLSEAPEIERQHKLWSASRDTFNADLQVPGSPATQERWQKMYFRGLEPSGEPTGAEGHRSRIRLKPFADTD